jgi:hypothetical protein
MRFSWMVIGVLFVAAGCGDDTTDSGITGVSLAQLQTAADTIEMSGHTYVLETYLWRDFQPISPPDGKPLIALIRLVEVDSNDIPDEICVDRIWVVNGDQVWAAEFSDEPRPSTPDSKLERVARDGPKWGPGIEVDVVVGVQAGSGSLRLLAARKQTIHRTD